MTEALEMVSCFLDVLGAHYFEFIPDTGRTILPLLDFRFSEDLRTEAFAKWESLIENGKKGLEERNISDRSMLSELLTTFCQKVMPTMDDEDSISMLQSCAQGISSCIKAAGPDRLTADVTRAISEKMLMLLHQSFERSSETPRQEDAEDEDEQEELLQKKSAEQDLRLSYIEV